MPPPLPFFKVNICPFLLNSPLRLNIFRLFVFLSLTQLYRYTPEIFLFWNATFRNPCVIASIAKCELNSNICVRRWINTFCTYDQYQLEMDSKFQHRMDNRSEAYCAPFPLLRWEYLYAMAAAIKNMDSAVTWPRYQTKKSEGSRVSD
jgi:hypothetical protein